MNDRIIKLITSNIIEDVFLGLNCIKDISKFEPWLDNPQVFVFYFKKNSWINFDCGILKDEFAIYTHKGSSYIFAINKIDPANRFLPHTYYSQILSMSKHNPNYKDFRI